MHIVAAALLHVGETRRDDLRTNNIDIEQLVVKTLQAHTLFCPQGPV